MLVIVFMNKGGESRRIFAPKSQRRGKQANKEPRRTQVSWFRTLYYECMFMPKGRNVPNLCAKSLQTCISALHLHSCLLATILRTVLIQKYSQAAFRVNTTENYLIRNSF